MLDDLKLYLFLFLEIDPLEMPACQLKALNIESCSSLGTCSVPGWFELRDLFVSVSWDQRCVSPCLGLSFPGHYASRSRLEVCVSQPQDRDPR